MPFYTFIMDYKGGTYISQIDSSSLKTACVDWANSLRVSEIDEFGEISKNQLIEQMKSEEPILLKGLVNAWCSSPFLSKGTALINIVQTEKLSDNDRPITDN